MIIKQIISGGQTGVDRAALDVAKKYRISYWGWCPHGCEAEDAPISPQYENMKETPSPNPQQRTEWNVRDSDGTLIIVNGEPTGGTLTTIQMARKHHKPFFILDLQKENKSEDIIHWIKTNAVQKLNIAGPRASEAKNIYEMAFNVLEKLLQNSP